MRVVADTNSVVSGLMWYGAPCQVLEMARRGQIDLFTSPNLLAELKDALGRDKFVRRLMQVGVTASELMLGFAALATLVRSAEIVPVIREDPEDDVVLGCALAARADAVVSGDSHLLKLKQYQGIPILAADEFLAQFSSR